MKANGIDVKCETFVTVPITILTSENYENVSVALFDRNMNHTLLLHANLLNADYLDEMVEIFQKHNYHFVSQTDVLEDKAYQTEITKYGPWGISWLDRWALSLGKAYVIKNDPQVPDFIKK